MKKHLVSQNNPKSSIEIKTINNCVLRFNFLFLPIYPYPKKKYWFLVKNIYIDRIQNLSSEVISNRIRTYNHLVRKQTLNYLAKLTKLLSCAVSTLEKTKCWFTLKRVCGMIRTQSVSTYLHIFWVIFSQSSTFESFYHYRMNKADFKNVEYVFLELSTLDQSRKDPSWIWWIIM